MVCRLLSALAVSISVLLPALAPASELDLAAISPSAATEAVRELPESVALDGTWFFGDVEGDPIAMFGRPFSDPDVSVRCDVAARELVVEQTGVPGDVPRMTLAMAGDAATLPAEVIEAGVDIVAVRLPATGPWADRLATPALPIEVRIAGQTPVVVPGDGAVAEVVEMCQP